jgi:2-polyprenyl-3-methyl-5-hydroxy-6-metoxy-1,4-benzoquinol methylase
MPAKAAPGAAPLGLRRAQDLTRCRMHDNSDASAHEAACSRVAAQFAERWLRIYAGNKLRSDPIYQAAFKLLQGSGQPLIDIGCGVGLLAFYLRERHFIEPITGLDCDRRKIGRARAVAQPTYRNLSFIEQDVCEPIAASGNVALFDVLHYLSPNEQMALLKRLAARVAPGGMLIVRESPRDGNLRFWLTCLAEHFAQATAWNVKVKLHFPTRDNICGVFANSDFSRQIAPLWGRTPFNNHLFVFHRLHSEGSDFALNR